MPKRKNRRVKAKPTPRKPKNGRPEVLYSKKQKQLAIQYVKTSGLWKIRLAKYLGISRTTLDKVIRKDKSFWTQLEMADAEFCSANIRKAKPDFILRTKYREEFPENVKLELGGEVKTIRIIQYAKEKKA